ncbi:unnamed protein product [Acanthoscelides obtectus]|uniref:Uncharacterized protein n=1 Tax=Acanthoscelides obtectus TaxID=200917 RepID=A0A9P0QFJ4_ACAOB|nr:unnamed protein product [Acanthoscelides obtectus]CAK1689252.1 hypothetical protein AOBTE_LOCUS37118 [Acanthoscelides obtectus]
MVTEMRLSNNLLISKVQELQSNLNSHSASKKDVAVFVPGSGEQKTSQTYSNVLKRNTSNESPVLLVKTKDGKSQHDVMKILTKAINPAEFNICFNGTKRIKNGAAVFCNEAADLEKLKNIVTSKLGNKYTVDQSQKLNPRIMIRNVKLDNQTDSSLIDNFISANDLDGFDASDIKIVVKLKSAVKDHHNLVLEVAEKTPSG